MRRVRRPEDTRLELSDGAWLLVKKRLNAGENRKMLEGMWNEETGKLRPAHVGMSKVLAYLIDWGGFVDADDKPIPIRDDAPDVLEQKLDALEPEDFGDILKAIDAHMEAMDTARAAEKNGQAGESGSSAISPSPASSTGDTSGSAN